MMQGKAKIYLVVADDTEELSAALRFTCFLSRERESKIGVLYALNQEDFSHWGKIEAMMQIEQRLKAEKFVLEIAAKIYESCGCMPVIFLEEGKASDAIIKVVNENPDIIRLILGGSTKGGDPGPLVSFFSGKGLEKLNVPLTIVPDTLKDERFGD